MFVLFENDTAKCLLADSLSLMLYFCLTFMHTLTHPPQYFNLEVKSIPKMKLYSYLNIWAVALSKMSTIHYRKICQNGKTNETEGRAYHKEMDAGGSWTVKQQKQFCLFRSMKKYVIGIYLTVR